MPLQQSGEGYSRGLREQGAAAATVLSQGKDIKIGEGECGRKVRFQALTTLGCSHFLGPRLRTVRQVGVEGA